MENEIQDSVERKNSEHQMLEQEGAVGQSVVGRKYLVFNIAGDRFAIPLTLVKEVIGITKITPVPDVPRYFKGLINLRGKIISTIDLRDKLKMQSGNESKRPCIIISEIKDVVVGTIVDDVAEVVGIPESQISHDLDFCSSENKKQFIGAARFANKPLTIILDLGNVIDIDNISAIAKLKSTGQAA